MPERLTRLFSSADDSSGSSDTSNSSSDLWARSAVGRFSLPEYGNDGGESPSKLALPGLVAALRASRARSSAAQAKASRLLEETLRLRKALKVARKGEERAEQCEKDLTKSEDRVRELECDNRCLRRDLEGAKLRTRKTEEKARHSLSTLRTALDNLEQDERTRCQRWRATTRSQRALLESLRRHVQRGHHSSPSYTAFQLMEQIFECLKTQESEARLHSPSPGGRPRRRRPRPSSPGFPLASSPPASPQRGRWRSRSPAITPQAAEAERLPMSRESLAERRPRGGADDEDLGDVLFGGTGTGTTGREKMGSRGRGGGGGGGGLMETSTSEGVRFFSSGEGGSNSEEDFLPLGEHAGGGGGGGGQDQREGGTAAGFSTEWAYRLAVTKLTAQLKAARERLRGEEEASRLAGERAEQEELRCRQLELEVEGLSAKVAAADSIRRRLEESLWEAKRERDVLKRKQHSTAATHALNAALGILHQRRMPPSSVYTPVAAAPPPPPPPPPSPPAPPPPPRAHQPSASPPRVPPAVAAAAAAAPNAPSPRAAAVQEATANEARYCGGGDRGWLEPSTLTPAYSGGESGGGGGGWWDGHERNEDAFAYQHQHRERDHQHQHRGMPRRHTADAIGEHAPETSAPAVAYPPRGGPEPPRSPPTPSAGCNSTHDRGGGVSGGGDVGGGGGGGSGMYDARSQIQRIVDDAVRNGTRGRGGGRAEGSGFTPASARSGSHRRRGSDPDPDAESDGDPLLRGIGSSRRPATAAALAPTAATGVHPGVVGSRFPTRGNKCDRVPTSAPESGRLGGLSVAGRKAGGGGGGGGGARSRTASSSWAQLGPRAVTREDLTRLDEEIASLSKTVEQAAMAQTRQKLRNVTD